MVRLETRIVRGEAICRCVREIGKAQSQLLAVFDRLEDMDDMTSSALGRCRGALTNAVRELDAAMLGRPRRSPSSSLKSMARAIHTQLAEAAHSSDFSVFDRDASLVANASLLLQQAHEAICDVLDLVQGGMRPGQGIRLGVPLADARFALGQTLELTADLAARAAKAA